MARVDRLVAVLAVLIPAYPMIAAWWYFAHAKEAPPALYIVLPFAGLAAAVALGWAFRRSKLYMLAALVALFVTCAGGSFVSGEIGQRQVVQFCNRLLASPQDASSHQHELAALSVFSHAECRIHDLTAGLWELGVYAEARQVGYIALLPDEEETFQVSHVRLEGQP